MYQVVLTGGSVAEQQARGTQAARPTDTFADKADAAAKAKRLNKLLSPGEKAYYGLRYKVVAA